MAEHSRGYIQVDLLRERERESELDSEERDRGRGKGCERE